MLELNTTHGWVPEQRPRGCTSPHLATVLAIEPILIPACRLDYPPARAETIVIHHQHRLSYRSSARATRRNTPSCPSCSATSRSRERQPTLTTALHWGSDNTA